MNLVINPAFLRDYRNVASLYRAVLGGGLTTEDGQAITLHYGGNPAVGEMVTTALAELAPEKVHGKTKLAFRRLREQGVELMFSGLDANSATTVGAIKAISDILWARKNTAASAAHEWAITLLSRIATVSGVPVDQEAFATAVLRHVAGMPILAPLADGDAAEDSKEPPAAEF